MHGELRICVYLPREKIEAHLRNKNVGIKFGGAHPLQLLGKVSHSYPSVGDRGSAVASLQVLFVRRL